MRIPTDTPTLSRQDVFIAERALIQGQDVIFWVHEEFGEVFGEPYRGIGLTIIR